MSISSVFSIPCIPGELFTSRTRGPLLLLSISTPATDNPIAFAALTAIPSLLQISLCFELYLLDADLT